MSVSIVIRARNAEDDLKLLLPRLLSQVLADQYLEIVIVDNASTDCTQSIARAAGARIVDISHSEFSWGRALNKGIMATNGSVILLLSADAVPIGNDWVRAMLRPFANEETAVVYGRQIPRTDATLDEWIRVARVFPIGHKQWSRHDVIDGQIPGLIASNACAAIRRSVWERVQFDEQVLYAEEIPWVVEVARIGFTVHYVDTGTVEHSHRDPALRQAKRLWELSVQRCRNKGREAHVFDVVRLGANFVKVRLHNLCVPRVGMRRWLEGVYRLPYEIFMIVWVGTVSLLRKRTDVLHRDW